jgi:hypothetical protein
MLLLVSGALCSPCRRGDRCGHPAGFATCAPVYQSCRRVLCVNVFPCIPDCAYGVKNTIQLWCELVVNAVAAQEGHPTLPNSAREFP